MSPLRVGALCITAFAAGACSFAVGTYLWLDRRLDFV